MSRIWLWMKERFPPAVWLLSIFFYFSSAVLVRSVTGHPYLTLTDFVGFVVVWSYFLMLRVLDEHKDYEEDCKSHPDRVLQRGVVTLGELKKVGAACFVGQIIANVAFPFDSNAALAVWSGAIVWTFLMTFEFFCKDWLKEHLFVYGFSHMLVTPMVIYWCYALAADQSYDPLTCSLTLAAALAFCTGMLFEVTRKTRSSDEEQEGVDTYSKKIGVKNCVVLASILVAVSVAIVVVVASKGQLFLVSSVLMASAGVGTLRRLLIFMREPVAGGRSKNEKSVALFIIVTYIILIISVCYGNSFEWKLTA
jgi:4-hydroxybenzoate polyprenyltransferase